MSIKWKIFMYLIGFCTLLISLLWLFQVVFLEKFYRTVKINEVKNSAAAITKNIDNEGIEELLERIAESNEVCIEVWSMNGELIYSVDTLRECIIHKMPQFEKLKLIYETQTQGGSLLGYYNRESFKNNNLDKHKFVGKVPEIERGMQETLVYSEIISDQEGNTFIVLINSIISAVNATVSTLRIQLYFITGGMILCSIILALIIAKRVSRPIEDINGSAKILGLGDYNVQFKGSGYKEINELSGTLTFVTKELSKVDELRRELIANISHDLRTPLTLIAGYAEVMRDLPDENNAENAQIIIDEAMRLTTLVNDMLDISKFESGVQTLNLEKFNLTHMIRDVIIRINELIKKDGYKIQFVYDSEEVIQADETRIAQAFYNLLINAINYTGKDKLVVVKQRRVEGQVRIEIIDTGEGIAQENLPYIWDRYYKIDKTHKRAVTGTGIGLSIVKSIIEMHEGQYGIKTEIGKGSTFWFSLKA